jgi:hypothetical protein
MTILKESEKDIVRKVLKENKDTIIKNYEGQGFTQRHIDHYFKLNDGEIYEHMMKIK